MRDKMKKLLENVVLKEKDFKGDDGISHVPEPSFENELPEKGTLPTPEGEGKSKEAKNADLKGMKKDEPKKLSEDEVVDSASEVVLEGEDLQKELNTVAAKISYYKKNYDAGEKKGVEAPEELKRLYKLKDEIKKKMQRQTGMHPAGMNESFEVETTKVDVSEDINAIFSSDDELSEEFKSKVTTIFETAVIAKANEVIKLVVEAANAKLEENFKVLDEKFDALHEGLTDQLVEELEEKFVKESEKMEAVTEKAIDEWKEENKVAIYSAAKVGIAESFMANLKDLFETHNIEIPTDKVDVTEALLSEVEGLKEKLEKEIETNLSLKEAIEEQKRRDLVNQVSESLTEVEKGKFTALSENIEYSSDDDYISKLTQIKESYFTKKIQTVTKIEEDEGIDLVEEKVVRLDPAVAATLGAMQRFGKK